MGRKSIGYLFILIVGLLLAIGIPGFMESSEARYAAIGYEMFSSGDYLHPYLLGIYHFHKPEDADELTDILSYCYMSKKPVAVLMDATFWKGA